MLLDTEWKLMRNYPLALTLLLQFFFFFLTFQINQFHEKTVDFYFYFFSSCLLIRTVLVFD